MFGHGVKEQDLIIAQYPLGAVVTRADLLAHSDIQILYRAQSGKP